MSRLEELALSLAHKCLSFDFVGTSLDESSEEFGIVQVPSAWRPVLEDPSNLQIFFDYYAIAKPPISNEKSVLAGDQDYIHIRCSAFKVSDQGLADHDNYHEYCRLLGRFKANYQEWIVECYQEKKLVAIEPYLMHVGKPWRRVTADQETTPLNKPQKPSIVASSKQSEPAEEDLSPAKVKKWAIDDLKETIAWLESQEERAYMLIHSNVYEDSVLCYTLGHSMCGLALDE
ncbi:hypothetical protein Scep_024308 [Stephania cephalantha]|uniref:BRCT domain-containing protein n=1 Tax=Stephania cephalantha TaxID=152367 RepID=A0AAP0F1S7_9MAGN